MRLLKMYFLEIIASIILLLFILIIVALIRDGYVNASSLTTSREFIETLNTFITTVFLILAAIFSYFRFFHGRTFAMQADIAVSISMYEMANNENILHVIDVEFSNNGAFPIREPIPTLRVYKHGISKISEQENIDWWDPNDLASSLAGIFIAYPREKAYLHAFIEIPTSVGIVTYFVQITARNGVVWTRSVTVGNSKHSESRTTPILIAN